MPIIAFNFDKLHAAKLKDMEASVKMKTDLKIADIKKKELPVGKVLDVKFDFNVNFSPKAAEIQISGYFYYMGDEKELDKIETEWKKDSTFSNQQLMTLFVNTILLKCNVEALLLEKEVGLPSHIRLPIVAPAEKKAPSAGKKAAK